MHSEEDLVDNFLGLGMEGALHLNEHVIRSSDRKHGSSFDNSPANVNSPMFTDSAKYESSGIRRVMDSSENQATFDPELTTPYTPPRSRHSGEAEGTNHTLTIGALSQFNNDESGNRFTGGHDSRNAESSIGYKMNQPEVSESTRERAGDQFYQGGDSYYNYEPAASRVGRGGLAPSSTPAAQLGYGPQSQFAPHQIQTPQEDYYGHADAPQHHGAPQQSPTYLQYQQEVQQGRYQPSAQAPRPEEQQHQQHQQQHRAAYPRGNVLPPEQRQMGAPQQGDYYGGSVGGYKAPYPQAYHNQQGYVPNIPAPIADYGNGPANNAYFGAPRFGKPMQQASQPVAYPAQPYGNRGMPEQDPYFRGGYPPAVPATYGYSGYPQQQRQDAYFAGGAGAVNRALGRPDDYGPHGQRTRGGRSECTGDRICNALPMADSVDLNNVASDTIVYEVQFKQTVRHFTMRPGDLTPVQTGEFVIVQADRGEDLGVITAAFSIQSFRDHLYAVRAYMDKEDQNIGYILRIASPSETKLLPQKFQDEETIFKAAENLAIHTYRLPLTIVDVEYQFDRHKITVFYDSTLRIDFRDLVRDLFSSFKARVWMKKINQLHGPGLQHAASIALATGMKFAGGDSDK